MRNEFSAERNTAGAAMFGRSTGVYNSFGSTFLTFLRRHNLFKMMRFAEVFPDQQTVSTLLAQLSWSHLIEIIPFENSLQRDFYTEMYRVERWSVRTLRDKIPSLLYERTAISRKPKELARQKLQVLREEVGSLRLTKYGLRRIAA